MCPSNFVSIEPISPILPAFTNSPSSSLSPFHSLDLVFWLRLSLSYCNLRLHNARSSYVLFENCPTGRRVLETLWVEDFDWLQLFDFRSSLKFFTESSPGKLDWKCRWRAFHHPEVVLQTLQSKVRDSGDAGEGAVCKLSVRSKVFTWSRQRESNWKDCCELKVTTCIMQVEWPIAGVLLSGATHLLFRGCRIYCMKILFSK